MIAIKFGFSKFGAHIFKIFMWFCLTAFLIKMKFPVLSLQMSFLLNLFHQKAVWIPQWLLSQEKLEVVKQLVQEQLHLGHIEPSVSLWNTSVFVIRKASGKW